MDPATVLLWLAAVALVLVGVAGAVFPAIPGMPLVFAGLWLAAWIDDYAKVGVVTLVVLGVLALLALGIDYVASLLGAKRVGASPQAVTGAAIGTVIGIFFGLVGVVLGPVIGAVIGEIMAHGDFEKARRVGWATWSGLIFGTLAKLALSLVMIGIFVVAYAFIP